jgi:SPP1 gp7 family putative phage head morphogenesis protein
MPTVAERITEGNQYVAAHIYALEAQTVNMLYQQYLLAYREMQSAMTALFQQLPNGKWTIQNIAAREHLQNQIRQQMAVLGNIEGNVTFDAMLNGYKSGLAGAAWNVDTSIYAAMGMNTLTLPLLPNEAIRAQLLAPYVGQTFVERFADNRSEFELRVKRALIQSQIQGEGVYGAQKRIAQELGIAIGRRTNADRASNSHAFAKTELIARTELLRASNNGALATYQANADVLQGWEWKAALGARTCPECGALDGQRFAFGQRQPPPLHGRCRCTVLPVLINTELMDRVAGKRVLFPEWAAQRGLTVNQYGQAFELRGAKRQ